jgi:non-ribosomal peptide synthetase component F
MVADPEPPLRFLRQGAVATAVEWNDTKTDYPQDVCIHQLFEAQAQRTPDAIAIMFEHEQLTYGELNRRTNQLAHHLQALGVGPEVPVGVCLEPSLEMVIGLLGILKAGGAYALTRRIRRSVSGFMLKMPRAGAVDPGIAWWRAA